MLLLGLVSLQLVACTKADVAVSMIVSPSEVNKFLELPPINEFNQTQVLVKGLCRDNSSKVRLDLSDSASTAHTYSVEAPCVNSAFESTMDLSSFQDGEVTAKLTSEKGFETESESYKDTVRPTLTLTAAATVNVHKDLFVNHTLVSSEDNVELDATKIRLTGANLSCQMSVKKNLFSSNSWNIEIGGCAADGAILLQLDEGVIKDLGGNINIAQVDLAPLSVYNRRLQLSWNGGASQYLRSASAASFPFRITNFDPSAGIPSWPGLASYLEKDGDETGCSFSETGTFPDFTLTVSGCTAAQASLKFRLRKDVFSNPAGLLNLVSDWAPVLNIDNTAPVITLTSPSVMSGGAGTTFTWTAVINGADNVLLSPSFVTLTGDTTNCAVSINGTGLGGGSSGSTTRTIAVSGCSVSSGTVNLNLLAGAATDAAGNSSVPQSGGSLTIVNSGPTLSIGTPNNSQINASRILEFPLTYTNAVSISLATSDISLITSGTVTGCQTSLIGSGLTSRTLRIQNCQGDGDIKVNIAAGTALSSAPLPAAAAGPSPAVIVDNTAPTYNLTSTGGAIKSAPFDVSFAFNESLNSSSNYFTTSDGSLSNFSVVSSTYGFLISPSLNVDTLSVTAAAGAYQDLAGNPTPAITEVFNIAARPQITLQTSDGRSQYSDTFQFDVVSDRDITAPTAGSFQVSGLTTGIIVGALKRYTIFATPSGVNSMSLKMLDSAVTASATGAASRVSNLLSLTYESPVTVGFSSAVYEITETESTQSQSIRLLIDPAKPSSFEIDLVYNAAQSTANGTHLDLTTRTLTIPANATTYDIPFNVFGDAVAGGDKLGIFEIRPSAEFIKLGHSKLWMKIIDDEVPGEFSQITVGSDYTCGITTSGVLKCWGFNDKGQLGDGTITDKTSPVVIDSGVSYMQITGGHYYTCGITNSGVLKCWGFNDKGQLGDGTTVNKTSPTVIDSGVSYTQIAVGSSHTCGITNSGVLKCWGFNDKGQLGDGTITDKTSPVVIDSGVSYTQIAVGGSHTCGFTNSGVLKCWGSNYYGQIGDGTTIDKSSPVVIDSVVSYTQIAVGGSHTCGITNSGVLKCWGANYVGQLGDGTNTNRISPVVIDSGVSYTQITSGGIYNCGITNSGVLKCWGYNSYSQLGDGTRIERTSPVVIDSGAIYMQITAFLFHTCGVTTSGALKCWGSNTFGQLGDGTTGVKTSPVVIDIGVTYTRIAVGSSHTCGITNSGVLKCWGSNYYGQIGDGTTIDKMSPVLIDSVVSYSIITGRFSHTCGITTSGALKCWGSNYSGQLGDGTMADKTSPVVIDSGVSYTQITNRNGHTCGITMNGVLKCWGANGYGQLGDGTMTDKTSPVVIDSGVSYTQIAVGSSHTCGITTSGVLKCWGFNDKGQLGDGTTVNKTSPTVIDSGVSYAQITGGDSHTCGITNSGVLKCWGANGYGQLGDGTTTDKTSPVVIDSGLSYTQITGGYYHTCGIATSGSLKCWGGNGGGQLGDGTTIDKSYPVVIDSGVSYTQIAVGSSHTCGIPTSGVLKCWGSNQFGELGRYINPQSPLPITIR